MSDLERRAEELTGRLRAGVYGARLLDDSADLIEQLLSENRQVRERANAHELGQFDLRRELEAAEARVREIAALYDIPDGGRYLNDWEQHRETARQDLDRISAEREAAQYLAHCVETDLPLDRPSALRTRSALESLRRILAETDRPHGENPYLPKAPTDGQHQWSEGPTDLGGNRRCTFCGAYKGSVEAERPCKGQFAESGHVGAR